MRSTHSRDERVYPDRETLALKNRVENLEEERQNLITKVAEQKAHIHALKNHISTLEDTNERQKKQIDDLLTGIKHATPPASPSITKSEKSDGKNDTKPDNKRNLSTQNEASPSRSKSVGFADQVAEKTSSSRVVRQVVSPALMREWESKRQLVERTKIRAKEIQKMAKLTIAKAEKAESEAKAAAGKGTETWIETSTRADTTMLLAAENMNAALAAAEEWVAAAEALEDAAQSIADDAAGADTREWHEQRVSEAAAAVAEANFTADDMAIRANDTCNRAAELRLTMHERTALSENLRETQPRRRRSKHMSKSQEERTLIRPPKAVPNVPYIESWGSADNAVYSHTLPGAVPASRPRPFR